MATDTKPTGSGKLVIGAEPWGEIFVDRVDKGPTPKELVVSAGHHVVEIVFSGVDPPRRQTMILDLANDETRDLHADFTKP